MAKVFFFFFGGGGGGGGWEGVRRMISTHANSPGLSGSLPDTERISRSPVRVTKPPG